MIMISIRQEPLALSANMRRAQHCLQFVKDSSRCYVAGNDLLTAFFDQPQLSTVLGRKTTDFFDDEIVRRYDRLDAEISSGRTIIDRFDFTRTPDGSAGWYLYARSRMEQAGGQFVRGISFPLPDYAHSDRIYTRLARATDVIAATLDEALDFQSLATDLECSIAQLDRDFKRVLGQSPKRYRSRLRVQRAIDAIRAGQSLTEAAHESGFSEHSALSRAFKDITGLTPKGFRATLS
jgi:AraC-like DNA-binding protein